MSLLRLSSVLLIFTPILTLANPVHLPQQPQQQQQQQQQQQDRLLFSSSSFSSSSSPSSRHKNSDIDDETPLPLLIWHGLGDSFDASGLRSIGDLAASVHPGTYVHYVHVGNDSSSDRSAGWFGNVTAQLEQVCAQISADRILSTAPAVDALGFSQGGQFLRGYVERCNDPPVRSLVTFGSQHNGITEFKECGSGDWLCRGAMALLRGSAWSSWVQANLVPAQYYRDPASAYAYDMYLQQSNFLADINNEREHKNLEYRENLARLVQFVMFMFEDDTVSIPKESSWFEEVNGTENVPLRARKIYAEDWLGLKSLDRKGGLKFRSIPGDHMELEEQVLNKTFAEFFGPLGKQFFADGDAAVMVEQEEEL